MSQTIESNAGYYREPHAPIRRIATIIETVRCCAAKYPEGPGEVWSLLLRVFPSRVAFVGFRRNELTLELMVCEGDDAAELRELAHSFLPPPYRPMTDAEFEALREMDHLVPPAATSEPGQGGTTIQKVEIVITSNQSPFRIARAVHEELSKLAENRRGPKEPA